MSKAVAERFVGRKEELDRLRKVLCGETVSSSSVSILSIEGTGGIGKTAFFEHALGIADVADRKYLRMTITGIEQGSDLLVPTIARLVRSADAESIRAKPAGYYFPAVDRVVSAVNSIRANAISEFLRRHPNDDEGRTGFESYFDRLLGLGKRLNDIAPITSRFLNFRKVARVRSTLESTVPTLKSICPESGSVLFGRKKALRNAIKENVCKPLADALVSNLSAILARPGRRDRWRLTHRRISGISRLLLIIDDYERLQTALGEFLVAHLLPELKRAAFETLIVIMGRDDLQATDTRWDRDHRNSLLKPIRLTPLTRSELYALVDSYGITSDSEKERSWNDTEGFPYYVQLWCEEAESHANAFLMRQKFYDRTVQWMSDHEREWLESAIFLDRVNRSTLGIMLGDAVATEAMNWFEREGSVRCTTGEYPRVREYIRSRLRDYLDRKDPARFNELLQKSDVANAFRPGRREAPALGHPVDAVEDTGICRVDS